jgi:hypothetical protein
MQGQQSPDDESGQAATTTGHGKTTTFSKIVEGAVHAWRDPSEREPRWALAHVDLQERPVRGVRHCAAVAFDLGKSENWAALRAAMPLSAPAERLGFALSQRAARERVSAAWAKGGASRERALLASLHPAGDEKVAVLAEQLDAIWQDRCAPVERALREGWGRPAPDSMIENLDIWVARAVVETSASSTFGSLPKNVWESWAEECANAARAAVETVFGAPCVAVHGAFAGVDDAIAALRSFQRAEREAAQIAQEIGASGAQSAPKARTGAEEGKSAASETRDAAAPKGARARAL